MEKPGHLRLLAVAMLLTALPLSPELPASLYQVELDDVNWRLTEKKYFLCRLYQDIPLFGGMAISASAGHQLTIELVSSLFPRVPDAVQLWLDPLPWGLPQDYVPAIIPDRSGIPVSVSGFHKPEGMQPEGLELQLNQPARQFLQMLNNHSRLYLLVITPSGSVDSKNDQYRGEASFNGQADTLIEVSLPTVGMLPSLRQMSDCIANLLPRSFRQLHQYQLHYASGQIQPGPSQRQWLVDTVRYLAVDPTITVVTIDGHSDNVPFKQTNETLSRLKNLELSEKRANAVNQLLRQYLQQAGVTRPLDIIVRHHGERYPVASNATASGRYQNRRVEIALEKNGLEKNVPEIPEINVETNQ